MSRWLVLEVYQEVGESWVDIIRDHFHSEAAANQFAYEFVKDNPTLDRNNIHVVSYRVIPE